MDFRHRIAALDALHSIDCDALLLVLPGDRVDPALDETLAALLRDAVAQRDLELKAGRTLLLHRPAGVKARRVLYAVAADASPKAFRSAAAAGLAQLKTTGAKHVAVGFGATAALSPAHAEAVVGAASEASYVYRATKPSAPPDPALARVTVLAAKDDAAAAAEGVRRGAAVAEGVALAREFANRPANHCTPSWLAARARDLGKQHGLKVEVLDRKAVEKLGMGAFLAVAQGSHEPLRFIVARYHGAPKGTRPVVLVGKGITFDTGGISIKPSAEMDEMKFDMGGAAAVLGTLHAVAALKAKLNLVVIVPATENMPGGRAVKPGDVVTTMSGQTVEILNTDAEGRLILCDALTYAERFDPAVVVDVATLTGACVVALGNLNSGLFTPDDELAGQLLAAGRSGFDPCWRLPLDDEYDDALKSTFADMANVGPRYGGAITAAMFLRRYTKKYRWAHLDVAGTAWKSGAAKGATGRPVALLTHFVLSQAA